MNKLEYLNNHRHVAIVPESELQNIDGFDKDWVRLFTTTVSVSDRIKGVLGIWEKYCSTELRNTIKYLFEHCTEIDVIKVDNRYSLLYTIVNSKKETLYYEGPLNTASILSNKESLLNQFPDKLKSFYLNIHDGFYYFASESMGLSRLENIECLSDFEWGILEELNLEPRNNLDTTWMIFTNGMGSYVCVDTSDMNAILWSGKREPKYDLNFWDIVDEWIVIGFES